jgi:hypothetical protein
MNAREATAEDLRSFGVGADDCCGECGEVKPVTDLSFWIQAEQYLEATCKECQSVRACGACGALFTDKDADSEGLHQVERCSEGCVAIVSMTALTTELQALGLAAQYLHSGGGCGTVYIGDADAAGMYEYAVGPSDYRSNTGRSDELNCGRDGENDATYLSDVTPFTPQALAQVIKQSIEKGMK